MAPPLEIHDMTVAYHRKPVLWDIDLIVPEGQLVAIVGPNGAGKIDVDQSRAWIVADRQRQD